MHALLQASPPVIEAWQVVALLGSIALVVLGACGTLIVQNRNTARTLRQRLFGAAGDETDSGFMQETEQRLDEIESSQHQHARQTHTQLYKLDQKMDVVLEVMAEENEDIQLPHTVRGVKDVPPPPGDFYRGGDSPNNHDREPKADDDPPESED